MDFENYTDRARGFIQSAQTLAIRSNHQLRELGADIILYALTTELDRTPARERNDSGDGTLLLFACFRHFPILKSLVSLYLVLRNSFERQQLRQQVGVGHGVCEEELGE